MKLLLSASLCYLLFVELTVAKDVRQGRLKGIHNSASQHEKKRSLKKSGHSGRAPHVDNEPEDVDDYYIDYDDEAGDYYYDDDVDGTNYIDYDDEAGGYYYVDDDTNNYYDIGLIGLNGQCNCPNCRSKLRNAYRDNKDDVNGCTSDLELGDCDFGNKAVKLCRKKIRNEEEILKACKDVGLC